MTVREQALVNLAIQWASTCPGPGSTCVLGSCGWVHDEHCAKPALEEQLEDAAVGVYAERLMSGVMSSP